METEPEWIGELRVQIRQRVDPWVVLEGRHAVEAAIGGWWDVVGILAGEGCSWEPPTWSGLDLVRGSKDWVDAVAGYRFHRGVVGLARQPEETADVQGLVAELEADATVVVCPGLADASNAGAVIRNAAALGAKAVLFGNGGVSPFERKAVRASSGALFRLPVRVADSGQILRCLKAGGFQVVGADGGGEAVPLPGLDAVDGRVALVIGSEADGLGSFWSRACDVKVGIPMNSGVDSLNAAAASAVMLWELGRARERAGGEE